VAAPMPLNGSVSNKQIYFHNARVHNEIISSKLYNYADLNNLTYITALLTVEMNSFNFKIKDKLFFAKCWFSKH